MFHKDGGNYIWQMAVPSWQGEAQLNVYRQHRAQGYAIALENQHEPVLLLSNGSAVPVEYERVIRLAGFQCDPLAVGNIDLTPAKWVKHPDILPAGRLDQALFEQAATQACESWTQAYQYRLEDVASGRKGLRLPQVGAVHAVQAHWAIDSSPATVVLPTGVGKTETMLSVLVAEKCRRVLVIVPTDVLRTQLANKFLTLGVLRDPAFAVIAGSIIYPSWESSMSDLPVRKPPGCLSGNAMSSLRQWPWWVSARRKS